MNENVILLVTNLFVFVLCAGLFMIIPQLTRKSYLFGVKIPVDEAGNKEAVDMKKRYMITCLIGVIILALICIVQFVLRPDLTLIATLYLPLFIIPIYLIAFIPNWKKAVSLKEERGWAVSNALFAETKTSQARGNLSSIPYVWYLISAIIVFFTIAATFVQYPTLPDLIPIHFDINMEPDGWANKTWLNALQIPLINLGCLVMMFFVAIAIVKAKLQIDPNNPKLSFAQHIVYRRRMGHAIGLLTLLIILLMAIPNLIILFPDAAIWKLVGGRAVMIIVLILSVLSIAPIIIVMVKTGQGGCKVKIDLNELNDKVDIPVSKINQPGRGDDKYWLLGLFYYNRDDPAIIVEARFGSKLSFNYAHLPVKIGLAILLFGLVALYVWLTKILI